LWFWNLTSFGLRVLVFNVFYGNGFYFRYYAGWQD
jgi:hypothetical protein